MSTQSKSCLKRTALGCGAMVGLVVILVGVAATTVYLDRPGEPQVTTRDTQEVLSAELPDITFDEMDSQDLKPVQIVMDFNAALVEITPGRDDGKVEVTGEYDEANFVLETQVEETDHRTIYRLRFKNKHSLLANIIYNQEASIDSNQLFVKLPTNLPLALDFKASAGNYDVDLGGLAMTSLNLDTKSANLTLSCSQPNRLTLQDMNFQSRMGNFHINDIQNYRFVDGHFDSRYGELTLSNSGDFHSDEVGIDMSMAFGNARIELPRSARVHSNSGATLGGSPKNRKKDYATLINLEGGVSFGDHTVTYRTRKPSVARLFQRLFREHDSPEDAIARVREIYRENPDAYDFHEGVLNAFGYRLLRNKTARGVAEAIEVFKFNVEIHPDYANGYDSLGEGYMEGGFNELAINNYEKSLELNPHNYNGKRMLHRLRKMTKPGTPSEPTEKDEKAQEDDRSA